MKGKRRHELQTNQLADWLGREIQTTKPYVPWVLGGLIVIVIGFVIYSIRSARLESSLATAWDNYQSAQAKGFDAVGKDRSFQLNEAITTLERIVKEHPDEPVGLLSQLAIADINLQVGQSQFRSNNTAAKDHFKKAAENYGDVATGAAEPELKNRARFGLAKSYEWQMLLTKAREEYAKVEGPFRPLAQARMHDLGRASTENFYTAYAAWKPKPKPAPDDSTVPEAPSFTLDDDEPGELNYQRYLDATAAGTDVEE
jgi:hypothetical protein